MFVEVQGKMLPGLCSVTSVVKLTLQQYTFISSNCTSFQIAEKAFAASVYYIRK
jgi:hypothetical protein